MFVALSASTFSLLAIGVERHPHHGAPVALQGVGAGAGCSACWEAAGPVSLLLGALPSAGWNCRGRLASCSTVLPLYAKSYVAFCISVFIALLAAIVALYTRIFCLVTSRGRRARGGRPSERSLALLRTVVIVLGVFVACWAPLFVLLLLDVGCEGGRCPVLYQADWFIAPGGAQLCPEPAHLHTDQPGHEGSLFLAAVLLLEVPGRPRVPLQPQAGVRPHPPELPRRYRGEQPLQRERGGRSQVREGRGGHSHP